VLITYLYGSNNINEIELIMKNEMAKAICIASIWISMSIVFTFGIFDAECSSGELPQLTMMLAAIGVIGATLVSTLLVLKKDRL
jgi:hypothetical protein